MKEKIVAFAHEPEKEKKQMCSCMWTAPNQESVYCCMRDFQIKERRPRDLKVYCVCAIAGISREKRECEFYVGVMFVVPKGKTRDRWRR